MPEPKCLRRLLCVHIRKHSNLYIRILFRYSSCDIIDEVNHGSRGRTLSFIKCSALLTAAIVSVIALSHGKIANSSGIVLRNDCHKTFFDNPAYIRVGKARLMRLTKSIYLTEIFRMRLEELFCRQQPFKRMTCCHVPNIRSPMLLGIHHCTG